MSSPAELNSLIFSGHDPFMVHLDFRDKAGLAQMIEDVDNNKWALTKINDESKWQSSVKVPACSKAPSVGGSKIISDTKRLSVRVLVSITLQLV